MKIFYLPEMKREYICTHMANPSARVTRKIKTVPVRVGAEVVNQLDELARVDDVSRSVIVRRCINYALKVMRRRFRNQGRI